MADLIVKSNHQNVSSLKSEKSSSSFPIDLDAECMKWAQEEQLKRASELHEAYVQEMLKEIPPRYQHATFESYITDSPKYSIETRKNQALRKHQMKGYADHIKKGGMRHAILCGHTGTGKTHLGFAVYRYLLEGKKRVKRFLATDLIAHMRQGYGRKLGVTKEQIVKALLSADYLQIDEVGHQYGTPKECVDLFYLIVKRYEMGRSTLITTNEDEDSIKKYINDPAYSRLTGEGGMVLCFDWEDYRNL